MIKSNSDDVLIKVENVSKKFCRSLKRSMLYGIEDIGRDMLHLPNNPDKLRKDEFWAVNDVTFEVKRGECLGIIGRNGAGKSTLLKMLNGIFMPDKGKITIKGKVGALIEVGAGFHPMLTGRENVYVNGAILGMSKREIDKKFDEIVAFAELEEFIDMPVKHYSSGMYVRLGFAIAAQMEPDVLILDEVLAVGDVSFQARCMNTIARFRKQGTAFLLVSHNMHQISRYSDILLYMDRGSSQTINDIEKGIDLFLNKMNETIANSMSNLNKFEHVQGTGKVKFINAFFQNLNGDRTHEISAGEGFKLVIDFECTESSATSTILELIIRDKEEIIYQDRSNIFYNLESFKRFYIAFESFPLNTYSIQFFFCLIDPNNQEIYDWIRNLELKIKYNSNHHGRLVLPVKLNVT